MSMYGIFNLVIFAALLSILFQLSKRELGLSRRVLIGLMLGSIFGFYLQLVVGYTAEATTETLEWTNVVANIYVNLLRMIIIPLVLITMMASVLKVEEIKSLGKIGRLGGWLSGRHYNDRGSDRHHHGFTIWFECR